MEALSITEANRRGISGLVRSAEAGPSVSLSRQGRVVAEIVSAQEIESLRKDRDDLADALLALSRFITDTGKRTELDDVIADLGFDRTELEAELNLEMALEKPGDSI